MELQLPKGMRDFSPEEKILRDEILKKITETFETYGFPPLETPIVERYDVLSAKFAAGETSDAMKETFKLSDQGKRNLGLRFDLTVPFARYVAMNKDIKFPFKRYQIGEVFRDGPIKLGRYREFWQCDVDTAGSKNMIADAEQIKLALDVFEKLELPMYMKVNNRKLLISLLKYCGVKAKELEKTIITIDKLDKIGEAGVKKELTLKTEVTNKILKLFKITGTSEQIFAKIQELDIDEEGKQGLIELIDVFSYFNTKLLRSIKLDLSLARGLGYYTGTIFEGFQSSSEATSSICGGGRYDNMIGEYAGKNYQIPAVGISFGLDVIAEAIKAAGYETKKTITKIYVIPIKAQKSAARITDKLRKAGVKTDMDVACRGITKNLDYADKMKIPYVLFVGVDELKRNKFKLKNMKTGSERFFSAQDLIAKLK
ncbi:histidine--tRNA ligase [archaeon]|nr:histidine--tRNA ligase [archaeon]